MDYKKISNHQIKHRINMAFTGYLSKFSLPELFQFLEEGYKTGLLTVSSLDIKKTYYIWVRQGRIVAAADSLDNKCLITMITQRGWINNETVLDNFQAASINMALGLFLKTQGLLQAEQLMLLFRNQLTAQVSPLFPLPDAYFEFDFQAQLPNAEMTGLSIPASEATLNSLRMLRDWSALEKKLPDLTSGLLKKITGIPQLRLEYSECQVLEYASGNLCLQDIANIIKLPFKKVQQISFRLIVTNLVEETLVIKPQSFLNNDTFSFDDLDSTNAFGEQIIKPIGTAKIATGLEKNRESLSISSVEYKTLDPVIDFSRKTAVSQSFLQNLVGFLQSKATN
jgi:Domain of unknown function (DUF4388)